MANLTGLGTYVYMARTERKITQLLLARRMGIGSAHLSLLESGQRRFSFTMFVKAAEGLGTTPARLLFTAMLDSGKLTTEEAVIFGKSQLLVNKILKLFTQEEVVNG